MLNNGHDHLISKTINKLPEYIYIKKTIQRKEITISF